MPKIESIIVSFNCLDLLSITLPRNINEYDNIIIVTKPEDIETIEYCRSIANNNITIFTTSVFNYDGAVFNKGLAIALAMNHLKYNDWIVTQDTDIILPEKFKEKFFNFELNKEYFYGMRRINIETKQDLIDLESGFKNIDDFICYRGSGYGYWACCNYNSNTYQNLLKE